ncbi:MAG: hypothetical protein K2X38_02775 [Gemmataceae bacterium]|nr:hypothetical protein [Gemmataceae bacterium]
MTTWQQFARMSNEELSLRNVAEVNLACAEGLPGVDASVVNRSLQSLEEAVKRTR